MASAKSNGQHFGSFSSGSFISGRKCCKLYDCIFNRRQEISIAVGNRGFTSVGRSSSGKLTHAVKRRSEQFENRGKYRLSPIDLPLKQNKAENIKSDFKS